MMDNKPDDDDPFITWAARVFCFIILGCGASIAIVGTAVLIRNYIL